MKLPAFSALLSTLLFSAAVAPVALALPTSEASITDVSLGGPELEARHNGRCLKKRDVDTLVAAYTRLIAAFDRKDARYLSDNFVEYADSINALANQPLGQPAFPSKEAFIAAQEQNPPIPLEVQHVYPSTCDTVALNWSATFGVGLPVRGVTVISAVWEKDRKKGRRVWKIGKLDIEFNGLAFAVNSGGSFTFQGRTVNPGNLGNLLG